MRKGSEEQWICISVPVLWTRFWIENCCLFLARQSLISRDLRLILQDEILILRGGNLLLSSTVCNSSFVPCFLHCHSWFFLYRVFFFANNQPNSVALKNTWFILDWFTEISVRIHYLIMMNKWSKLKFNTTYLTNSTWSLSVTSSNVFSGRQFVV